MYKYEKGLTRGVIKYPNNNKNTQFMVFENVNNSKTSIFTFS